MSAQPWSSRWLSAPAQALTGPPGAGLRSSPGRAFASEVSAYAQGAARVTRAPGVPVYVQLAQRAARIC